MRENLSDCVRECLQHAEDCERQAALQTDPALRRDLLDAAAWWLRLARSYEFVDQLSRFTLKPKGVGHGVVAELIYNRKRNVCAGTARSLLMLSCTNVSGLSFTGHAPFTHREDYPEGAGTV